jgi:ABC-2 type transport system permease protein
VIRTVRAIVHKELRELWRDPVSLSMAIVLPIVLLVVFTYGLNVDIQPVRLGFYDLDQSQSSRDYQASLTASGDLRLAGRASSSEELGDWLDQGQIDIGVIVPPDFERRLHRGQPVQVQVLVDASLPPQARGAVDELDAATAMYSQRLAQDATAVAAPSGVMADARVWFNPELRSTNFLVPGLFAFVLMVFGALLSTLAIVRERELGSIQQVLVAPVSPAAFIIGKAIPYALLAFVDFLFVLAAGLWWFHIPMRGSLLLLVVGGAVYVFCAIGFGLLISTLTRSQVVAMLLAIVLTMMPSLLYSGFIFPTYSMPAALQVVSLGFPARYFTEFTRGIALKGAGLDLLWPDLAVLVGLTSALLVLATSRFRRRMA